MNPTLEQQKNELLRVWKREAENNINHQQDAIANGEYTYIDTTPDSRVVALIDHIEKLEAVLKEKDIEKISGELKMDDDIKHTTSYNILTIPDQSDLKITFFNKAATKIAEINLETCDVTLHGGWEESGEAFWNSIIIHGKTLYQRIADLEKENAQLQKERAWSEVAREALEFYGSKENWVKIKTGHVPRFFKPMDSDENDGPAGEKAREALKKREEILQSEHRSNEVFNEQD